MSRDDIHPGCYYWTERLDRRLAEILAHLSSGYIKTAEDRESNRIALLRFAKHSHREAQGFYYT